ncbi:hypothetical protein GW17_00058697 [Ensete ventricosum]|nr:hypothetical protein GW17_00058697 [Ensete ventricosum]
MAMEGQRDAKKTTLIPNIRTLMNSKLGGDHYRGSASMRLYRGSLLQIAAQSCRKYSSIHDKKWRITRLFIHLLTLIPRRTLTSRLLLLSNS